MLMDCGYGPLEIQQLRIGDTGIENFRDVEYAIHPAWRAGDALSIYKTDTINESFGTALLAGVPEIRTTATDTSRITVELAFPRGLVLIDDRGTRREAAVDVELGFRVLGSGAAFTPIDAVKTSASTPISSIVNLLPLTAIGERYVGTVEQRYWQVQDRFHTGFFPGMTSLLIQWFNNYGTGPNWNPAVAPVAIGDTVWFQGDPYTVTSLAWEGWSQNWQKFRMGISPPLVVHGYVAPWMNSPPVLIANTYQLAVTHALPTGQFRIGDNTAEPLFFSISWDVPPGQYEVRIMRITADGHSVLPPDPSFGTTAIFSNLAWNQIRSAADRPPIATRDPHTIIELKIRANDQLSGAISNLNCIATAVLPVWDEESGTFIERPTRNPAWAYLDVLRGTAATRPLDDERIDFDSLKAWAAYCDEDVDNGINGDAEQRVYFDHVVDYATTTFSMLNSIAAAGRATPTIRDGKHGVVVDEEQTVPVQLFTPRNSWGFSAKRSYMIEPDGLRVKFIDPASWNESEVVVYASGKDESSATTFEELKLLGVTRYSQATRDGRYMKAQALLRREEFTIQCDVESLVATRGDLVVVQHDVLQVGGESTRIASVSGAFITLVEPFGTLAVGRYGVRLRLSDGTVTPPIEVTPHSPDVLELSEVPTPAPAAGDLLAWGDLGIETGEYLVKNIAPGTDFTATITLVEIARAIYDADTGYIPPYSPPAGARPESMVGMPAPERLTAQQVDKTVSREPYADVVLSWAAPSGVAYHHFRVFRVEPNGVETAVAESLTTSALVRENVRLLDPANTSGVTSYAVYGIDVVGKASAAVVIDVQLVNPRWRPDAPGVLSSNLHDKTTVLTWLAAGDTTNQGNGQVIGYEVRWIATGEPVLWGTASRVTEIVPWNITTVTVASRNGAYMVKAITTSGVESDESSPTVTAVENLVVQDIFHAFRFNPEWIGRHDGTEIDDLGRLILQRKPDGTFVPFGVFYSHVREVFTQLVQLRVSATSQALGISGVSFMFEWVPLSVARPIEGAVRGVDWDVSIWVYASATPYVMADWVPLSVAVPLEIVPDFGTADWRPLIHGEYVARAVSFAVVLQSMTPNVTPMVSAAGADIDFPERTENYSDIVVPAAGLDFLFTWPFVFPPSVAVELQSAAVNDRVVRGPVGTDGFHIDVKNGGSGVGGVVDIAVNGVGRLLS